MATTAPLVLQDMLVVVTSPPEDALISTNALLELHAILWSLASILLEVTTVPTAQPVITELDTPIALSTALPHV